MKDGVPSGPPCPCIPQEARTEFRRCNAYLGTTIPETVVQVSVNDMLYLHAVCLYMLPHL